MVILLIPNLGCQLRCKYCFEGERPIRTAVDAEAMKKTLELLLAKKHLKGSHLGIHGGEPTLVDRDILEDLAQFASRFTNSVTVQTNGLAIDDQLIDIFGKYNMNVGVSIDGSGVLNSLRGPNPGNRTATKKYTDKVQENIRALCDAKISVSVLSVLHELNVGTQVRLQKFEEWLLQLREWGVKSCRLNLMFATNEAAQQYELNPVKAAGAWIALYEFRKLQQLQLNPFMEMIKNLKGCKVAPCVYSQCDMFSTHCITVLPDGSVGNCDRTFGPEHYLRSVCRSHPGRYRALWVGQCKGCRYWNVCHGGCPIEGAGGDWRNKTRHCLAIYNLYEWIERDLTAVFDKVNLDAR